MSQRELEPSIHVHLKRGETYGDYLALDDLLSAQHPRSNPVQHDEMLFIIQHQTSELWMKLMLHELDAATRMVKADELKPSFKVFARVAQIQRILFDAWNVLETLTPADYLSFRSALGQSSGFQSYQYRGIEFALGNKDKNTLAPFRNDPEKFAWLEERLKAPSLYDEFIRLLHRRGFTIDDRALTRDFTAPYAKDESVQNAFARIYNETSRYWEEYDMCEKLVDIEERFQLWRFRHMKTVHRVIGLKQGTGGSSGVSFLKRALDFTFFPELWDVRTELKGSP